MESPSGATEGGCPLVLSSPGCYGLWSHKPGSGSPFPAWEMGPTQCPGSQPSLGSAPAGSEAAQSSVLAWEFLPQPKGA